MQLIGVDFLASIVREKSFSAKMVFNSRGAIFFAVDRQHREMSATGIRYEDDYKGNALAAMLAPGSIEVRYHKAFTNADVARVISALLDLPELSSLASCRVTYQGRSISRLAR